MSDVGVWKRALLYLGLVDQEELDETDEVAYEEPPPPPPDAPVTIRKLSQEELREGRTATVAPLHAVQQPLGQVHIVEPKSYDDAQEIGDKLKSAVPVIMNLQGVDDDLRKRLTAFGAGLAYGLDGEMQRLAPNMYLITPRNVEVSAEDRRRLAARGLFNEF